MSRFEARLARLEAAQPVLPSAEFLPASTLALDFADVVAASERFTTLSPKQKIAELRAELRQERQPSTSPVACLSAKLGKIHLCFRDITESHLRDAEIALLVELGHPDARHPLTPDLRELIDVEVFDL